MNVQMALVYGVAAAVAVFASGLYRRRVNVEFFNRWYLGEVLLFLTVFVSAWVVTITFL